MESSKNLLRRSETVASALEWDHVHRCNRDEALCDLLDFVWIDMEHNALWLEAVQAHIIATKGSRTVPLVRVRTNDPVLIKPVLDIGAAGIIVPWFDTVQEATLAVQACRYPPQGIRGIGPRRASNYGRSSTSIFPEGE